ncbi:Rap1 Myb domain [Trinorchestia longiramus]|nr:Rap1 Myb domain [Trinorchestia longiramus]
MDKNIITQAKDKGLTESKGTDDVCSENQGKDKSYTEREGKNKGCCGSEGSTVNKSYESKSKDENISKKEDENEHHSEGEPEDEGCSESEVEYEDCSESEEKDKSHSENEDESSSEIESELVILERNEDITMEFLGIFSTLCGDPIAFSMYDCPEKARITSLVEENDGIMMPVPGGKHTIHLSSSDRHVISVRPTFSCQYVVDCIRDDALLSLIHYRMDQGKAVSESMLMKVMLAVESWPDVFSNVHVTQSCVSPVEKRASTSSPFSSEDESHCVNLQATRKNLKKEYEGTKRKNYSHEDRMAIVRFILDNHLSSEVNGRQMWEEMACAKVCHDKRSWQSLKEHFRKQIVHNFLESMDIPFPDKLKLLTKYPDVRARLEAQKMDLDDTDGDLEYDDEKEDRFPSPPASCLARRHARSLANSSRQTRTLSTLPVPSTSVSEGSVISELQPIASGVSRHKSDQFEVINGSNAAFPTEHSSEVTGDTSVHHDVSSTDSRACGTQLAHPSARSSTEMLPLESLNSSFETPDFLTIDDVPEKPNENSQRLSHDLSSKNIALDPRTTETRNICVSEVDCTHISNPNSACTQNSLGVSVETERAYVQHNSSGHQDSSVHRTSLFAASNVPHQDANSRERTQYEEDSSSSSEEQSSQSMHKALFSLAIASSFVEPSSPGAGPASPSAGPASPGAGPASPGAGPASPGAGPASPSAGPASPSAGPDSPSAGPDSPSAGSDSSSADPDSSSTEFDSSSAEFDSSSAEFDSSSTGPASPGAGPASPGAGPASPNFLCRGPTSMGKVNARESQGQAGICSTTSSSSKTKRGDGKINEDLERDEENRSVLRCVPGVIDDANNRSPNARRLSCSKEVPLETQSDQDTSIYYSSDETDVYYLHERHEKTYQKSSVPMIKLNTNSSTVDALTKELCNRTCDNQKPGSPSNSRDANSDHCTKTSTSQASSRCTKVSESAYKASAEGEFSPSSDVTSESCVPPSLETSIQDLNTPSMSNIMRKRSSKCKTSRPRTSHSYEFSADETTAEPVRTSVRVSVADTSTAYRDRSSSSDSVSSFDILPTSNIEATHRWRKFTRTEDMLILDFILKNRRHKEVGAKRMWEDMVRVMTGLNHRSWHSVKERYRKIIVKNITQYDIPEKERKLLVSNKQGRSLHCDPGYSVSRLQNAPSERDGNNDPEPGAPLQRSKISSADGDSYGDSNKISTTLKPVDDADKTSKKPCSSTITVSEMDSDLSSFGRSTSQVVREHPIRKNASVSNQVTKRSLRLFSTPSVLTPTRELGSEITSSSEFLPRLRGNKKTNNTEAIEAPTTYKRKSGPLLKRERKKTRKVV